MAVEIKVPAMGESVTEGSVGRWLKQAGEIAVCLPNQVSLELSGGSKPYDSLNY